MNLVGGGSYLQKERLHGWKHPNNTCISQKRTTVGEPGEDLNGPRIKSKEPNLIGCDAVGLKYSNPTPFSTGIPLKSRPEHRPVTKSTLFKPTLYKSHCEGSFMCEPNNINGPQRNCVPTIGAVCGKACALAQVAVESTLRQA